MRLVDDRGKLFGRVNLIDATVAFVVLGLVPLSYAAYRVFRIPPPDIQKVEPAEVEIDKRQLRLRGRNFVPYLRAFIWETGQPLPLVDRVPTRNQGTFLIESPTTVEIRLPDALPLGTYDLYLFNETEQVAYKASAFSLVPPRIDEVPLRLQIRFVTTPETAALVQVDESDYTSLDPPHRERATMRKITIERSPSAQLFMAGEDRVDRSVQLGGVFPGVYVDTEVTLGGRKDGAHYTYGNQRLLVGQVFTFQGPSYILRGLIREIDALVPTTSLDGLSR